MITKKYNFDIESGGLLLSNEPCLFSLEPRPVYKEELDLYEFNKVFDYPNTDKPLLWNYNVKYIDAYSGTEPIAHIQYGEDYETEPFLITDIKNNLFKHTFKPIDMELMIEKNKDIVRQMTEQAQEQIYNTYEKYKNEVDLFYVSFSGGKDSLCVLDLVRKTLPNNTYKVIFGNTQMEYTDTYQYIDNYISPLLKQNNIEFYTAQSYLKPKQTWNLFAPPSNKVRWCCGVHKTAPQVLLLKELTKKTDLKTLVFIGVRGSESLKRSKYTQLAKDKKHINSYSFYPILYWNSAQVYLYIFSNNLKLNDCYKKGCTRCGCLCCPMTESGREYTKYTLYKKQYQSFIDIIEDKYINLTEHNWRLRTSGRDIKRTQNKFKVKKEEDKYIITVDRINNRWKEWSKCLGELKEIDKDTYLLLDNKIIIKDNNFIIEKKNNYKFFVLFKAVIIKMLYCVNCCYCASECPNGAIEMTNTHFKINEDKCKHCHTCLTLLHNEYCLRYNSIKK